MKTQGWGAEGGGGVNTREGGGLGGGDVATSKQVFTMLQ